MVTSTITIKEQLYTLKVTGNKRQLIYSPHPLDSKIRDGIKAVITYLLTLNPLLLIIVNK